MWGKFRLALVFVACLAVIGGCSGSSGGGSGDGGSDVADLPPIQHNRGPAAYRQGLAITLKLLNRFWTDKAAGKGRISDPPKALVSYWTRKQDKGCGGVPAGFLNAQYCSINQTISWDGNWLYWVLYRHLGEAAVSFLLAHEYGHLVQDQLGIDNRFHQTIEAELNADCLAGAWLGAVNARITRLDQVDYQSLYDGMLEVADPQGIPWNDPTAHGTAAERGRALDFGATHGPNACLKQLGPGFTA
ncbi:MAG: neutral zinc metallopeptidase [Solirubrobacterales bacterium]|nr:neutral zinc metallopeptidase [Solirubrobacterales bacterium]MCB0859555.1 neutral zinc metallopeptidase [Solirubrobacterales bacterium]